MVLVQPRKAGLAVRKLFDRQVMEGVLTSLFIERMQPPTMTCPLPAVMTVMAKQT